MRDWLGTVTTMTKWPRLEIEMTKEQIGGIVRALLAAAGGYFVGQGMLDGATMETIAGAVATLVTALWSVWAKKAE